MDDAWYRNELSGEERRAYLLGYTMGLIVGEGSFCQSGGYPAVQVLLHERDPKPLLDLLLLYGGKLYGPYRHNGSSASMWRLSGQALAATIPLFLRHLPRSHKRGQFLAWAVRHGYISASRAEQEGIILDD